MTSFLFSKNIDTIENDHYTILGEINQIEIREYKKLIYASYTPKNKTDRNNSFRNVANYIFGSNNSNEKIDMTSPVVIKLHNKNEMAFIMPQNYTLDNLPKPKSNEIKIYNEESSIKACLKYNGYSNDNIEQKKIEELKKILKKNNIEHKNNFEVLVYNSPWKVLNRRNEVIVSIDYKNKTNMKDEKKLYLGGGCFWCTEAIFEDVIGVKRVASGYAGGTIKNPSYKEVSSGLTDHAEVCEIIYNKQQIQLDDLLKIFFLSHDPTTLNRQGNDIGKHYRSIILYQTEEEEKIIRKFTEKINQEIFENKIVTEITKLQSFYKAENYHQNYYQENSSAGYCKIVINPKVLKIKKELGKYYRK